MNHHLSLRATFRRKFFAGLFVTVPALVSVVVLIWIFKSIDGILGPVYDRLFGRHVEGMGFISAIVLIFIAGTVSTNVIGNKVIKAVEKYLMNIPVFRSVYSPVKSIMDAFSKSSSFKKFVIVQYPRPGVYAFGFLTREGTTRCFSDGRTEPLQAIYIPTNNLYLGEVALFKPDDVFCTDIAVEDGVKIILSGGIATPDMLREAVH
ncbi:MAG: DUF502 domain-containing protein [Actinomycetota bacterium]|nr:DUF502 domain-containing protein [Actinomycetota bacterium]